MRRGAGTRVGLEDVVVMFFPPVDVPPMPKWHATDDGLRLNRVGTRRLRYPTEKRLPDIAACLGFQSLMNHADVKLVFRGEMGLFAPMVVEKSVAVEANKLPNQAAIGIV